MQAPVTDEMLRQAARDGKTLEIRGRTFSRRFQAQLEGCLSICLETYERAELLPIVYAVAQELALWASLANMRQIYFEDYSLDLSNPEHLDTREAGFQASINRGREGYFRQRVKDGGLYLRVRIMHNEAGVRIEVLNNSVHSEILEDRLRTYLAHAMEYRNIMDYYRDHPEDSDGRGMGLAFALLMLREEQMRPELMRLGSAGEYTVSRLEIPFDASYESLRDRVERGEDIRPFSGGPLVPASLQVARNIVHVRCPVCGNSVDERVFFSFLTEDMIDVARVRAERPDWQLAHGACASCLATYDLA